MRLTYTLYAPHPRTLYRDTDEAGLFSRSNDAAGWKTDWDQKFIPYGNTLVNQTTVNAIAEDTDGYHQKALILCLLGSIDNLADHRQKAIDAAKHAAQNLVPNPPSAGVYGLRTLMLGMVYTYDLLYNAPEMTSGNKTIIRDGIHAHATNLWGKIDMTSRITSHSGGYAMCLIAAGIAIADEKAGAAEHIQRAADYLYGASAGDSGRIDYNRYFGQDGGELRGVWYACISHWYMYLALRFMENGFIRNADIPGSLLLDGQPYAPMADEDWLTRAPEWFVRRGYRADKDILQLADTGRITDPVFHWQERHTYAGFLDRGGSWKGPMRWVYDQKDAWSESLSQRYTSHLSHDFVYFDKAAVPAVHPRDAGIPRSRFQNPPGDYHYVHPTWDIPNSASIYLHLHNYYIGNHQHLDVGSLQVWVKDEAVLLNTGRYHTTDYNADYNGSHHRNWLQQSISKSGVPLVEGQSSDLSDEHYNRNLAGLRATYKNGLGGQSWTTIGGLNGKWEPETIAEMRTEGGGAAWLKCTAGAQLDLGGGAADFVYADIRRAYLKDYQDFDGALERVRIATLRHLILKTAGPWPIIFRVARIKSRLATAKKRDHWHFNRAPTFSPSPRLRALSLNQSAQVYIDHYQGGNYSYLSVGGGPVYNGVGDRDFLWGGTNWRPTAGPNFRQEQDFGHYRIEVSPVALQEEDYFVTLIMPMSILDSPPNYTFFEETNYFGVDISGTVARIHKTLDIAIVGTPDTEPPAPPQGLSATPGPGSGEVTLDWTPNSDDAALYRAYYRLAP